MTTGDYIGTGEAGRLAGVSGNLIRKWFDAGMLECFK